MALGALDSREGHLPGHADLHHSWGIRHWALLPGATVMSLEKERREWEHGQWGQRGQLAHSWTPSGLPAMAKHQTLLSLPDSLFPDWTALLIQGEPGLTQLACRGTAEASRGVSLCPSLPSSQSCAAMPGRAGSG